MSVRETTKAPASIRLPEIGMRQCKGETILLSLFNLGRNDLQSLRVACRENESCCPHMEERGADHGVVHSRYEVDSRTKVFIETRSRSDREKEASRRDAQ